MTSESTAEGRSMTETREAKRTICEHCGLTLGWPCANQYEAAHCLNHVANLRAERDALREALERIEDASRHYASCTHLESTTLAYAHESTARLARAAITGEAKP